MAMYRNCNEDDDDEEEEEREKWLTHYSSNHQILLVGDGDFSFSLCLARSFGSALNILASSFDSYDEVIKKYKEAKSNLTKLRGLGAVVLHGVDATRMRFHADLMNRRFDRIIFNFPHAGFHGKEGEARVIDKHKALVRGFFSNAKGMLRANGEIHVNHKTTAPFSYWNLEILASSNSLALIGHVEFKIEDYPLYKQKRGDGKRCDQPFPFGAASTFKFGLSPRLHRMHRPASQPSSIFTTPELFQVPNFSNFYYPGWSQIKYDTMLDRYDTTYQLPWRPSSAESGDTRIMFPQRQSDPAYRGMDTRITFPQRQSDPAYRDMDTRTTKYGFDLSRDQGMNATPEFLHQRSYRHMESRSSGFDRTSNQDTRFWAETNRRTWYGAVSPAYDCHSFDWARVNYRADTLRLVREYGSHEEPFSSDDKFKITRIL